MTLRRGIGCVLAMVGAVLHAAPPRAEWKIEQVAPGTATQRAGELVIQDTGGCTAWWSERLVAPVEISYEAKLVIAGG